MTAFSVLPASVQQQKASGRTPALVAESHTNASGRAPALAAESGRSPPLPQSVFFCQIGLRQPYNVCFKPPLFHCFTEPQITVRRIRPLLRRTHKYQLLMSGLQKQLRNLFHAAVAIRHNRIGLFGNIIAPHAYNRNLIEFF